MSKVKEELPPINDHPLQGLWLARGVALREDIRPFESAMACADIAVAQAVVAATGTTFDGDYFQERRKVETWLKTEARQKVDILEVKHPIYFRLYPHPVVRRREGYVYINFPVEYLSPGAMTFTLYDSFHNFAATCGRQLSPTPTAVVPRVFSSSEIADHITSGGFPTMFLDGTGHYIECQVWQHRPPVFGLAEKYLAEHGAHLAAAGIATLGQ